MSAYIVFIRKSLTNKDEMKQYSKLAKQASEGHTIKPTVFYGAVEPLENIETDGVAILEFPNMAEARAWYESPAYQQAKQHRDLAAEYMVFLTEGLHREG